MHRFHLPLGWSEGWSQGQGLLLLQRRSGKSPRGFRWIRVLVVAVGTNEGFKWIVEQYWETIMVIAPAGRTLIFCYA